MWSVAEAAALLDAAPEMVERVLELRGGRPGMFAGAFRDGEGGPWLIPERDVRTLVLGRSPERMLSIQSVAELLDASYHHVYRRLKDLGLVVLIPELGIQRVREADVWRLCGLSSRRSRPGPTG